MDRFIPSLDALHPFERWGRIVVHDLGESELARSGHAGELVVRRERHIWDARKDLDLPEGFTLALECQEGADGIRRWTPGEPAMAFVLRASLAGQAILQQAGLLTEDQSRSYHAMRAFFQLSSRLGAYPMPLSVHAARDSDEFRRYWAHADGLDADSANSRSVRSKLVNRSRYEVANNGFADGMTQTHANYLVGKGPALRIQELDADFARRIELKF